MQGSLVVAFAGYTKPMEDLIAYNEGLPGRFPITLMFEDFSDKQMLDIYVDLVKNNKFLFEGSDPKYARILSCRLGRRRGESHYQFMGTIISKIFLK